MILLSQKALELEKSRRIPKLKLIVEAVTNIYT